MLISNLKLPQESNTKASNFTSLRMVLPKLAKWRRILVRVRAIGLIAFQKRSVYVDFKLNLSYSAIVWPLIFKTITSTYVIRVLRERSLNIGERAGGKLGGTWKK